MNEIKSENTVKNDLLAFGFKEGQAPYDFRFAEGIGFTPCTEILEPTQDNQEQSWFININYDIENVTEKKMNISGNILFISEDGQSQISCNFDNTSEIESTIRENSEGAVKEMFLILNTVQSDELKLQGIAIEVHEDSNGNMVLEDVLMYSSRNRITDDVHFIDYENQSVKGFIDTEGKYQNDPWVLEHDNIDVLSGHIHSYDAGESGISIVHFRDSSTILPEFGMNF